MSNKIFDLGFHKGEDSAYYLSKGFNVVAVEANPSLVIEASNVYSEFIKSGDLILLNRLVSSENKEMTLYVHPTRTEWSSIHKYIAEQDGQKSSCVDVFSISLTDLCGIYGTPYYLKVDIEGCDVDVAQELVTLEDKPDYVSFELNKNDFFDIFTCLYLAGYRKFQLRNQANNNPFCSGEFALLLPDDKWMPINEALSQYVKYRDLKIIDNKNLALGWMDIHATF